MTIVSLVPRPSTSTIQNWRHRRPGNEATKLCCWTELLLHQLYCFPPQMWLTFAPIPDFTARYYNVPEDNVDWFSVVYFIVSLLMGLFSIVVLDTWGLKVSVSLVLHFFMCLHALSTVDIHTSTPTWPPTHPPPPHTTHCHTTHCHTPHTHTHTHTLTVVPRSYFQLHGVTAAVGEHSASHCVLHCL